MVRHILLIRLKDGCKDRAEELSALFLSMREYQKDPYHCGVVKPFVASIRETAAAVDFETDGAKPGDAE